MWIEKGDIRAFAVYKEGADDGVRRQTIRCGDPLLVNL